MAGVVMDRQEYIKKAKVLLGDPNTDAYPYRSYKQTESKID